MNIQISYRKRGALGSGDITAATAKLLASSFDGGHLIVTNAPLSFHALERSAELLNQPRRVEVVTWNDDRDDDLLRDALLRNAR